MCEKPPVEMRLRLGDVIPVEAVRRQEASNSGRHVNLPTLVGPPRFQQKNSNARGLRQARCEHAPRGAGADDDVVVLVRHGGACMTLRADRVMAEPMKVTDEMLATIVGRRADDVAAPLEA